MEDLSLPERLPDVLLDAQDGVVVQDLTSSILAIRIPGACLDLNVSHLTAILKPTYDHLPRMK